MKICRVFPFKIDERSIKKKRKKEKKKNTVNLIFRQKNGPVDPPYRWNTGEHHCYLHNYLAMALIVPRGKQAEPGRSILHRDVLYVFDTSPVSCPTVDVASRNKTFSPSCAKLANLQGRFFARYIPEVQRCHAAGAIFSHRACARDNCARIKKLRDAIVITYRVFLSVFIIFLPPNQWNNRWK